MRIVAGEWKGRKIAAPSGPARPTADRVREAWMSIVLPWLAGASVVDLFAGSGALGLEALSRGARHATFVESNERSLAALRANISLLGAGRRAAVVRRDALRFAQSLDRGAFDVAFADPPYASGLAYEVVTRWLITPFAGVLGVEHSSRDTMPAGGDTRRYGDSAITFYHGAEFIEAAEPATE